MSATLLEDAIEKISLDEDYKTSVYSDPGKILEDFSSLKKVWEDLKSMERSLMK